MVVQRAISSKRSSVKYLKKYSGGSLTRWTSLSLERWNVVSGGSNFRSGPNSFPFLLADGVFLVITVWLKRETACYSGRTGFTVCRANLQKTIYSITVLKKRDAITFAAIFLQLAERTIAHTYYGVAGQNNSNNLFWNQTREHSIKARKLRVR